MIRSRYLSTFTLAALLGSAPAWAQFTDSAKSATSSPSATATNGSTTSKPLCSELNHPNAGKLAGKDTGMAGERSSSPVHMDCIPDSQASAQAGTNAAAAGTNAASASTNQSADPGR